MDDATRRVGGEGTRAKGRSRKSQMSEVEAPSPDTEQRALEIREEIERTRDDMSETIDAIQDRLTPANLVAQAGETVRNAATEKVKQMANSAGHAADQLLDSSLMETVRLNPIPAAMIGIGAAWLLMKGRSGSRASGYARGSYRSGYGRDRRNLDAGSSSSSGGYGSGYGAVGTSDPTEAGGSRRAYTEDLPFRARQFAGNVRNTAARTGRRAQVSFDRVLRDNPLALGAAAVIVGAAVGMSIPGTETENELMGEARDTVVEGARNLASDAASKVGDSASKVSDAADRPMSGDQRSVE
jgi:Protein of unknown function (DUF3618)